MEPHDGFHSIISARPTAGRSSALHWYDGATGGPQLRVRIAGVPLIRSWPTESAGLPGAGRFECRGFVEDIAQSLRRPMFSPTRWRSAPMPPATRPSRKLCLPCPPVILPHGGPSRFVTDGKNGIVAANEDEFVSAIEHLYRHPEKRRALGIEVAPLGPGAVRARPTCRRFGPRRSRRTGRRSDLPHRAAWHRR